ncbi:hypothetical protein ES702_06171 [subsurface metagenome]
MESNTPGQTELNEAVENGTMIEENDYVAKDLHPNALVRQSNNLINGQWRMNLNQSRIFLTAVSMVESKDGEFERYRIKGKQLKDIIELKGNSFYDQLKKDVSKLMTRYIHVRSKNEEGKSVDDFISLVSSARYVDGKGDLILKFDADLRPFLIGLKEKFTQFKLKDALNFKSMYSLRLYMLIKQFDKTGWRYMSIEDIRQTLGLNKTKNNELTKDLYPLVADLKRRVLEPAVKELVKYGFPVKMTAKKDGRKMIGFEFRWKTNADNLFEQNIKPADSQDEKIKRAIERLRKFSLNERQIKYLINLIPLQEIHKTSYGIEMAIQEGKVQGTKVGGYSYATFKKKYKLENF